MDLQQSPELTEAEKIDVSLRLLVRDYKKINNMPILQKDFESMSRYGRSGQRAALILRKRPMRKAARR